MSQETVPVPGEVFLGRSALRDPLDPMGSLGFLGQRERPVMEEDQASAGCQDLPAKQDLEVALVVRERRALRTTPLWVWG